MKNSSAQHDTNELVGFGRKMYTDYEILCRVSSVLIMFQVDSQLMLRKLDKHPGFQVETICSS